MTGGDAGQDDEGVALRRSLQAVGITEERFAAAVAEAKRAEFNELVQECLEESLPEALEELIDEMAEEEDEPTGRRSPALRGSGKSQQNGKAKKSGASRRPGPSPSAAPRDSAPGDDAPENLHWSQRPIFGGRKDQA